MTKPTVSKHWRKPVGLADKGLNHTRTTPPCYNNTTLGNRLYAWRKGPNVTNPIWLTCKNCSHKCAADCEHCHTTQHRAVLIIFPLNLQTNTITRMLSSGGEGSCGCTVSDLDLHSYRAKLYAHNTVIRCIKEIHCKMATVFVNNTNKI